MNVIDRLGGPAGAALVVICLAGLVASAKFILDYQSAAGWSWWADRHGRPNLVGRWLMMSRVNLAVLLALVVVNRWFGDWTGRDVVTLIVLSSFIIQATVWPTLILHNEIGVRTDDNQHQSATGDADASPMAGDSANSPGDRDSDRSDRP